MEMGEMSLNVVMETSWGHLIRFLATCWEFKPLQTFI